MTTSSAAHTVPAAILALRSRTTLSSNRGWSSLTYPVSQVYDDRTHQAHGWGPRLAHTSARGVDADQRSRRVPATGSVGPAENFCLSAFRWVPFPRPFAHR